MTNKIIKQDTDELLSDIKNLIAQAKGHIVHIASSSMTTLYWRIGKRLKEDILGEQRAEYGLNVISSLAKILAAEYGKGFTYSGLTRMVRFYEQFSESEIVATVSQQLTWSHIVELLPIEDISKREYYAYIDIHVAEYWSALPPIQVFEKKIQEIVTEAKKLYDKKEELTKLVEDK